LEIPNKKPSEKGNVILFARNVHYLLQIHDALFYSRTEKISAVENTKLLNPKNADQLLRNPIRNDNGYREKDDTKPLFVMDRNSHIKQTFNIIYPSFRK
jgi:hypothetical protein